jgi:hypothetical protein
VQVRPVRRPNNRPAAPSRASPDGSGVTRTTPGSERASKKRAGPESASDPLSTPLIADAGIDVRYDHNRDGRVTTLDLGVVRANRGRSIELFTAPVHASQNLGHIHGYWPEVAR